MGNPTLKISDFFQNDQKSIMAIMNAMNLTKSINLEWAEKINSYQSHMTVTCVHTNKPTEDTHNTVFRYS